MKAIFLRCYILFVSLFMVASFSFPACAELEVRSAILMDMGTGQLLYEQNADEPIPPASLTKVLTMYMAMEKLTAGDVSLESTVRVSRGAARTRGSRMALTPNERVPLEQLLLGMAVSSGNDATAAVAEFLGGSQQDFVLDMNRKARELGMRDSYFSNPHGLPAPGQVTTARDMLVLSYKYLRTYPHALRYHSTRYMRHNGVVTYNKNPLLGNYNGADGLKTGWVNASGYNLISTVEQGQTRLLAVILGAENSKLRGRETHRLIEAGFMAARGEKNTVAEALPQLQPASYVMTADKTAREAYAVLAPESLKQAPKKASRKNKSLQQAKGKGKNKQVQQARKKSKPAVHAQKPRKGKEMRQASLAQGKHL